MPDLMFDDRVAVVTGGGRRLGRAHALLLASRGAKVVVNDPGGSLTGDGADSGPAHEVVGEIRAAGGDAVACAASVATAAGGKAIIAAALDAYGRIDILIHNAGNVRRASLKEMTYEDFDAVVGVHLLGGFHVVRPAFPVMCEAGYGALDVFGRAFQRDDIRQAYDARLGSHSRHSSGHDHIRDSQAKPRYVIWNQNFGHLGTGLPYAVGASVAEGGKRPVMLLTSDSAFLFHIAELETAATEPAAGVRRRCRPPVGSGSRRLQAHLRAAVAATRCALE